MKLSTRHGTHALAILVLAIVPALANPFIRSDFNDDRALDIADPVKILEYLFVAGGAPGCLDAGDVNDDSNVDIADVTYALGFLFLGGPPPASPYPACGVDPTEDSLTCEPRRSCRVRNIANSIGHCGGVPRSAYPNSLKPGDDLHKVTLDFPQAVCNDGSPGVFYVRPAAPDSPDADRWVIYLQGGGGCGNFESCLLRWCGLQSPVYDEAKMSSIYTPDSIGGTGIHRRDGRGGAENAFGDFNQVFLYYCSSDSWSGRNSNAVLTDDEDPSRQYSLHFQGHNIVRAVIARLMEGGVVDNNERVMMPALEDAELVLVTGFSAGSGGVAHNGDWIASRLEPNGTIVRLVRDAAFKPLLETHPDPDAVAGVASLQRTQMIHAWSGRFSEDMYDAFVDESAYAALAGTDNEWRLADKAYISHNHITTPTFVRMDLLDRPSRESFAAWGVSAQDFAVMVETTLRNVPRIAELGIEGSQIAQPGGSFGALCRDHVGLMSGTSFFARTVDDDNGIPRSYHDTLVRWLDGAVVTVVDHPGNRSTVCGGTVEENE